jgi:hypothetical protein
MTTTSCQVESEQSHLSFATQQHIKNLNNTTWKHTTTKMSLQKNMIFPTQKVMDHDICEVKFVVSSITMYNM